MMNKFLPPSGSGFFFFKLVVFSLIAVYFSLMGYFYTLWFLIAIKEPTMQFIFLALLVGIISSWILHFTPTPKFNLKGRFKLADHFVNAGALFSIMSLWFFTTDKTSLILLQVLSLFLMASAFMLWIKAKREMQ